MAGGGRTTLAAFRAERHDGCFFLRRAQRPLDGQSNLSNTPSLSLSPSTTPSVKIEYVDSKGKKLDGLVSQSLELTPLVSAAEPGILTMLLSLASIGLLGQIGGRVFRA
jgi:hypothetical protein